MRISCYRPWPSAVKTLSFLCCFSDCQAIPALEESETPAQTRTAKNEYNLFHPTPRRLMREMSTDRPDQTESPYTIDAGHFQVEMDLIAHTRDHDTDRADLFTRAYAFLPLNLKAGLLNNLDLQLMLTPFTRIDTEDRRAGVRTKQSGFGDVTARLKYNVWGNDGSETAFGIMPFVTFPTSQDELGAKGVEAGLIFPLAITLPKGWGMGLMTEIDFRQDQANSRYHTEWINTVTFGHDLIGRLGGYVEFFSSVSAEQDSPWVGSIDVGLTYSITDDIQIDAGANLGITAAADDVSPFVGLSIRF